MPVTRVVPALLATAALFVSSAPLAADNPKVACVSAHERAQSLRRDKKLRGAREQFAACARSVCPAVVRKECAEQLDAMAASIPSVVFEARDAAGADTTAVRVLVDGEPAAQSLSGAAVEIDPGQHTFRFELTSGSSAPIEQRVLVLEGDKNRKVAADFSGGGGGGASSPAEASASGASPTREGGGAASREHPPAGAPRIPAVSWVLGTVGIVALAGFGVFAYLGKKEENDLASSCAPRCTNDSVEGVKRDYLIADISLVVGVAAAGAAVILALPALTAAPVRGGAVVGARGTF